MTGMERLVAAINGTLADRIPVFCNSNLIREVRP